MILLFIEAILKEFILGRHISVSHDAADSLGILLPLIFLLLLPVSDGLPHVSVVQFPCELDIDLGRRVDDPLVEQPVQKGSESEEDTHRHRVLEGIRPWRSQMNPPPPVWHDGAVCLDHRRMIQFLRMNIVGHPKEVVGDVLDLAGFPAQRILGKVI